MVFSLSCLSPLFVVKRQRRLHHRTTLMNNNEYWTIILKYSLALSQIDHFWANLSRGYEEYSLQGRRIEESPIETTNLSYFYPGDWSKNIGKYD